MSLLDGLTVTWRGVIGIGDTCPSCDRPEPVIGAVGKGRPLDTFAEGYFCQGHALRVPDGRRHVHVGLPQREVRALGARVAVCHQLRVFFVDGDGWECWGEAPGTDRNDADTLHVIFDAADDAHARRIADLVAAWPLVPASAGHRLVVSRDDDWAVQYLVR